MNSIYCPTVPFGGSNLCRTRVTHPSFVIPADQAFTSGSTEASSTALVGAQLFSPGMSQRHSQSPHSSPPSSPPSSPTSASSQERLILVPDDQFESDALLGLWPDDEEAPVTPTTANIERTSSAASNAPALPPHLAGPVPALVGLAGMALLSAFTSQVWVLLGRYVSRWTIEEIVAEAIIRNPGRRGSPKDKWKRRVRKGIRGLVCLTALLLCAMYLHESAHLLQAALPFETNHATQAGTTKQAHGDHFNFIIRLCEQLLALPLYTALATNFAAKPRSHRDLVQAYDNILPMLLLVSTIISALSLSVNLAPLTKHAAPPIGRYSTVPFAHHCAKLCLVSSRPLSYNSSLCTIASYPPLFAGVIVPEFVSVLSLDPFLFIRPVGGCYPWT
ncbi:hypothetical protein RHS01_00751 [Rhizoctonia solani]|uniref:Transmembrane protein n=1 Tax=Rhizoctonia solani TaxID=456999 RepID=A0A8H7ILS4_9AGAM|nr:hypothetical protein RHS01_00751 [Rhizoctonia solani]